MMKGTPTYQKLADIIGLSAYEAKLYLAGVSMKKPLSLTEIAKKANIPRTAAYPPLQSLTNRGLISILKVGKRFTYQALDPKYLDGILTRKKIDLKQIVGELSRDIFFTGSDFSIQHFTGKHGVAIASEILLSETKTKLWKTFETAMFNPETIDIFQFEDYIQRRVDKNIFAKVIISTQMIYPWFKKRLEKDKEELRENIIVSDNEFPFEGALAVTKGLICYISSTNEPFAVVIRSEQMARTVESIHDLIWSKFKK